MVLLGKAQEIWDLKDEEFVDVPCPEWKIDGEVVTVRLRCLSGSERDRYEQSLQRMVKGQPVPDAVNARARLVAWAAVDESGHKIFNSKDDVLKLGMKNAKALNRLWEAGCKISGIDFDGSLTRELEEDFDGDQSEPSTSD